MAQVTSDTGGEIILSFPDASFKIQRHMTYTYLESNDTMEILAKQITISESNRELEVLCYYPKCGSSSKQQTKLQLRMILAQINIEKAETNI